MEAVQKSTSHLTGDKKFLFRASSELLALSALLYFVSLVETASWRLGVVDDVLLYTFVVLCPAKYWKNRPRFLDSLWGGALWSFLCALWADWYFVTHIPAHCGNPAIHATIMLFYWIPLLAITYGLFRRTPENLPQNVSP